MKEWWIKRVQYRDVSETHYPQTSAQLGLERTERDIMVCKGRIQGSYPIYLPRDAVFTKKLIQFVHYETLHGGVGTYDGGSNRVPKDWVPCLRGLVKKRSDCWGCKRFRSDRTYSGTAAQRQN